MHHGNNAVGDGKADLSHWSAGASTVTDVEDRGQWTGDTVTRGSVLGFLDWKGSYANRGQTTCKSKIQRARRHDVVAGSESERDSGGFAGASRRKTKFKRLTMELRDAKGLSFENNCEL